jgi:hypothetical protein
MVPSGKSWSRVYFPSADHLRLWRKLSTRCGSEKKEKSLREQVKKIPFPQKLGAGTSWKIICFMHQLFCGVQLILLLSARVADPDPLGSETFYLSGSESGSETVINYQASWIKNSV